MAAKGDAVTGPRSERMLTLRSGGWVLLLGTLIAAAGTAWRLAPVALRDRPRLVGDGVNADSYGFDLHTLSVPRERVVASGVPRDGIAALVDPPLLTIAEASAWNEEHRGKYLVPGDRVIGVVVGDQARAYPLRVLNWHEVVNDVVGGEPVAVTWHPLSQGIAVFSRRVGERTVELGVSGLLYNSCQLLWDRGDTGTGSLWLQLRGRAVSGPAAAGGEALDLLPFALTTWGEWRERHPEARVLAPDPSETERYARDVYGSYFSSGRVRYPVEPMPPETGLPPKTPVWIVDPRGHPSVWTEGEEPEEIRDGTAETPAIHAYWFAWFATRPEDAEPAARPAEPSRR